MKELIDFMNESLGIADLHAVSLGMLGFVIGRISPK
jgi:hypothetical protein